MISTNNQIPPPAILQESFGNLALRQQKGLGLLGECLAGAPVSASQALALSKQLSQANENFEDMWAILRINIPKLNGAPISIHISDYSAIVSFLNENEIGSAISVGGIKSHGKADCLIDDRERVIRLSVKERPTKY